MIKETEYLAHGGTVSEFYCDTCHVKIFDCTELCIEQGQELKYSPILCESCGIKRNDDNGKKVRRIQQLEKIINDLMNNPYLVNCQAIIVETRLKHGVENLDYFNQDLK